MTESPGLINSLTVFRFIAALIVFLFHCSIHLQWRTGFTAIDHFFSNGAVFMTGFFVLSGFIMTYVYHDIDFTKRGNIFDFFVKRFAKIYPAYAVGTVVYFLFFNVEFLKSPLRVIFNDAFLAQAFFPSMTAIGLNGGTWSLTVEMFLYFLFPFLIILLNKRAGLALTIGFIIASLASLNVALGVSDAVYTNPALRVSDFLIGIGFYFLTMRFGKRFERLWSKRLVHLISPVLIAVSCVALGSSEYQYMFGHAMIAPLFGMWIFSIYHRKGFFYDNSVMVYLGKISYSFYIWQFVAIDIGKRCLALDAMNLHLIVLMCFISNVAISSISYKIIEEPFRRRIIGIWKRRRYEVDQASRLDMQTITS